MKATILSTCSVVLGLVDGSPTLAQVYYMNPRSGTVYNGYGLPVSGPNPGRVLQYNSTPSYQRNYIQPNGSTMNGLGLPTSGPNPRMQLCLQNPSLC